MDVHEVESAEKIEWERAARIGRRRRRPALFGLLAGLVVAAATVGGMAAIAQDRQDRADRGETVYEPQGVKTTLEILVLPVVLGMLAFVLVFKARGGRLAPEYERSLKR